MVKPGVRPRTCYVTVAQAPAEIYRKLKKQGGAEVTEKTLYLPDVPLSEIVAQLAPFYPGDKSYPAYIVKGWDGRDCTLSDYVSCRPFPSGDMLGYRMVPGKALVEFFRGPDVLHTGELNLAVIDRDGETLLSLQHNLICGSYWLKLVSTPEWDKHVARALTPPHQGTK